MSNLISRRQLLGGFAFSTIVFSPSVPGYAKGSAENYVENIGADILALANGGTRGNALRNKFANLLSRHVNLSTIASSSLGTYRSKLPSRDKGKFNELVTIYAAALFVYYVDKFQGSEFEIDNVVQQGSFTIVKSKIVKSSIKSEPVVWYLSPRGNSYQVVDLSILGVRLSIAMRDAFSRELRRSKGDFEELYAFLREAETW